MRHMKKKKIPKQLQTIVEASVLREVTMLDRKENSCIKQESTYSMYIGADVYWSMCTTV